MPSSNVQRDFRNKVFTKEYTQRILYLPEKELAYGSPPENFYKIQIKGEEYILLFLYVLYDMLDPVPSGIDFVIDDVFLSTDFPYRNFYDDTEASIKPNITRALKGELSNYKYESAVDTENKYTDIIMLCIPSSNFEEISNVKTLMQDVVTFSVEPLNYYSNTGYGFVVNSSYEPYTKTFGEDPSLEDVIKTLASWGAIMVPLTDSELQMENRPKSVQKLLKSIEHQFARDYIREQAILYKYNKDEDLDMVRNFLEDPMNEDAFEYLAEYMFPALIKQGELPSNFPLIHQDFLNFLSPISFRVVDTLGGIEYAISKKNYSENYTFRDFVDKGIMQNILTELQNYMDKVYALLESKGF